MFSNSTCVTHRSLTNLVGMALVAVSAFPWPAYAAEPVSFEIVTESAGGPPYPTENIVVKLLEGDGAGGVDHTATILFSTAVTSDKATPKLLEAVVKGRVAGQDFLQFDLSYDGDGSDLQPNTFFDITYRIAFQGQPGTTPELSVSDFLAGPDGILAATCNMGGHKAGGGGTGVGRVGGKMHLEDISLGIISVGTTHSGLDPFFDITYRVHLNDPGQILPNRTLARLTFSAQSVPEPASLALLSVGALFAACCSRRRPRATRHTA